MAQKVDDESAESTEEKIAETSAVSPSEFLTLKQENADLRKTIETDRRIMQEQINYILQKQGQATTQTSRTQEEIMKEMNDRVVAKVAAVDQVLADKIKELRKGLRKYDCYLTGEPLMKQLVGGQDDLHAVSKFMAFFGIKAITDPNKRVVATLADSEDTSA